MGGQGTSKTKPKGETLLRTRKEGVGLAVAGEADAPAARAEEVGLVPVADTRQKVSSKQIARRAYDIHLARGGGEGGALEDWLRAERELRGEAGLATEEPPSESDGRG